MLRVALIWPSPLKKLSMIDENVIFAGSLAFLALKHVNSVDLVYGALGQQPDDDQVKR
jgi:hypothetical protein